MKKALFGIVGFLLGLVSPLSFSAFIARQEDARTHELI